MHSQYSEFMLGISGMAVCLLLK